MSKTKSSKPNFYYDEIKEIIKNLYDFKCSIKKLQSYSDQNFLITDNNGNKFIFKVSNPSERKEFIETQELVLEHLNQNCLKYQFPQSIAAKNGESFSQIKTKDGILHIARLLTFIEGTFLSENKALSPEILYKLGEFLSKINKALKSFDFPVLHRKLPWDLKNTLQARQKIKFIQDPNKRRLVEYFLLQFESIVLPAIPLLRSSIIHNDANDNNVLISKSETGEKITGIIDFGDMIYTNTINELAIALTYILFEKENPIETAMHVIRGYHSVLSLQELELELLYYLICARLCISVTMSAYHKRTEPDNEYITISEKPAWELLDRFIQINPERAKQEFKRACGLSIRLFSSGLSKNQILKIRKKHVGKSLSISYQKPLKIVRGALQYLYDDEGKTYLDAVNNVPNVGHCHPKVVKAAQQQMAKLNTNTRYLHDYLVHYVQRLTAKIPDPLKVCFIVNSGSEANDLALRLARNYTKQKDIIVVDCAYHGTTSSDIEISPYKFNGP